MTLCSWYDVHVVCSHPLPCIALCFGFLCLHSQVMIYCGVLTHLFVISFHAISAKILALFGVQSFSMVHLICMVKAWLPCVLKPVFTLPTRVLEDWVHFTSQIRPLSLTKIPIGWYGTRVNSCRITVQQYQGLPGKRLSHKILTTNYKTDD